MLNHQYRKKITWALDPSTGACIRVNVSVGGSPFCLTLRAFLLGRLRFVTEDKIEKGTEAFNNYGPKGNEELLMVPPQTATPVQQSGLSTV